MPMTLEEYERIVPNMQEEGLTFVTPNTHVAWRVSTTRTKEPDTFAWSSALREGDVLFDIGANIGQYSLLAAKNGARVHAFEPEAQNFALLVQNIALNNLSHLITPWPVALSNSLSLEVLHLSTLKAGGSCHSYGESRNFRGEEHVFPHQQGSVAFTLDYFILCYGRPTHIKIDVDGFEHKVLYGISDENLSHVKSVLVETNNALPEHQEIAHRMEKLGFIFDPAQVEAAMRTEGPFKGVGNVIWNRE